MQDELIIFDCDGVLVDSEIIASRRLAEALTDWGLAMDRREVMRRFRGVSMASLRASAEAELGRAIPDADIAKVEAQILADFDSELQPVEAVVSMLRRLQQIPHLNRCVASSSSSKRIRHALQRCDLWRTFSPNVFSAQQVSRGKPAPDLFLYAAAEMGVPPSRCTVVEDSEAGIVAARAAGMRAIGFIGGSHLDDEHDGDRLVKAGAHTVVSHMYDLLPLIRSSQPARAIPR